MIWLESRWVTWSLRSKHRQSSVVYGLFQIFYIFSSVIWELEALAESSAERPSGHIGIPLLPACAFTHLLYNMCVLWGFVCKSWPPAVQNISSSSAFCCIRRYATCCSSTYTAKLQTLHYLARSWTAVQLLLLYPCTSVVHSVVLCIGYVGYSKEYVRATAIIANATDNIHLCCLASSAAATEYSKQYCCMVWGCVYRKCVHIITEQVLLNLRGQRPSQYECHNIIIVRLVHKKYFVQICCLVPYHIIWTSLRNRTSSTSKHTAVLQLQSMVWTK